MHRGRRVAVGGIGAALAFGTYGCDEGCTEDHRCFSVLASNAEVGLLIDSKYAYYGASGSIRRVPLAGGAEKILVRDQDVSSQFALHDGRLYWSTSDAIHRTTASGRDDETLLDGLDSPSNIAADDEAVYFSEGRGVFRLSLDDRTRTVLATTKRGFIGTIVPAGSEVYFASDTFEDDSGIYGVPATGLGRRDLGVSHSMLAFNMAFDETHLYATYCEDHTVVAVALDGAADSATVLASQETCPYAVTVDDRFVYFTNQGRNGERGSVKRVPLAGGDATLLADVDDANNVLVDGDRLYFSGASGDDWLVMRVGIDGGPVETLATEHSAILAIGMYHGSLFYWADAVGLVMVPLDGGPPVNIAKHAAVDTVMIRGRFAYWIDFSGLDGSVGKTSLDTGFNAILAPMQRTPWAIAADDHYVYWSDFDGKVSRVSSEGGPPKVLARFEDHCFQLAVGPRDAFCALDLGGLRRFEPTGEPEVLLAPAQFRLDDTFAMDRRFAYFATDDGVTRQLAKVPIEGGEATTVVTDLRVPGTLALDAEHLYWADADQGGGIVYRVPLAGGTPVRVAEKQGSFLPDSVAVDDTSAYFISSLGDLVRVTPK